jgi:hypothetical protein
MKATNKLNFGVSGHCKIQDELGNVYVDNHNDIHPQNMSRVIARALANEHNFHLHRIAFGNGGTSVDAAFQITYKTPNTGVAPDPNTWDSRLYNEVYSEIIDDSSILIGTDPGSFGPNAGQRPGGGANPSGDPTSVEHVSGPGTRSNELGIISQVVITAVLNPNEPAGQFSSDNQAPLENTETDFMIDELGLYTTGAPAIDSAGSQAVTVGNKTSIDDSGLLANTQYSFTITVDGGTIQVITFTTPAAGGSGSSNEILYGDIIQAIMTGDTNWNQNTGDTFNGTQAISGASVSITNTSTNFSVIPVGAQTFGKLLFSSLTTGAASTISLIDGGGPGLGLFASLNPPVGGVIDPARDGKAAGVQNDPVNFQNERERLLTHLIFSPFLKSANRTLTITYTLTVTAESA